LIKTSTSQLEVSYYTHVFVSDIKLASFRTVAVPKFSALFLVPLISSSEIHEQPIITPTNLALIPTEEGNYEFTQYEIFSDKWKALILHKILTFQ
jgi:hypothetical protein